MIAYFYKSYSDGQSQYFNLELMEESIIIISLMGVHFEIDYTENDIIQRADQIAASFPNYNLDNIIVDYGDSSINNLR